MLHTLRCSPFENVFWQNLHSNVCSFASDPVTVTVVVAMTAFADQPMG